LFAKELQFNFPERIRSFVNAGNVDLYNCYRHENTGLTLIDRTLYHKDFICLLFANMFFWMSSYAFVPVLPLYYHHLGMNDHQIGLAIGAFAAGSVLFRVVSGKAVDSYGSLPVVTAGVILSTAAIINYQLAVSLLPIMLARFIHGAGISGYTSAGMTLLSLMNHPRHLTRSMAMFALFTTFGIGISTGAANWIYDTGGIQLMVFSTASCAVLSMILYPRHAKVSTPVSAAERLPFSMVLANPGVIIPTVNLMCIYVCYGSIMTFLPLLMLSHDIRQFSPFYIAYSVTIILARGLVSRLSTWFPPSKSAFYFLVLIGVTMLMAGNFVNIWVLVLCGFSMGAGMGMAFPTMAITVSSSSSPANRGTAFGLYTMSVDVGMGIGAILMGAVASAWGYRIVFLVAGVMTVIYAAAYRLWLVGFLDRRAEDGAAKASK
jgi:MFS family permease